MKFKRLFGLNNCVRIKGTDTTGDLIKRYHAGERKFTEEELVTDVKIEEGGSTKYMTFRTYILLMECRPSAVDLKLE